MRKILLAATALAALAGSAHAAGNQLPMTGLNAGSFSGSSASIGNPGGVPTSVTSLGALQNGETHVVTSGNASSQTTLGLTGSTSNSNSTGSVSFTTDGTPNPGNAVSASVSRSDQAFTSGGVTVSGTLPTPFGPVTGTYANDSSALSGQSLSIGNVGGPGSNAQVTSSGNSYSDAQLGLTTTANANSTGSISGNNSQYTGFNAERVDNASSNVGVGGSIGDNSNGLAGNLGAEANAGHTLGLSEQVGTYNENTANSISDTNNAYSETFPTLSGSGLGTNLTVNTTSNSKDSLGGGLANTPYNGGNYYGTSAVNAQTNEQLSGSLSLGGNTIDAGGISGAQNTINP